MIINKTWVRFEKNGEELIGRKGKIKTDKHQSLFLEVHDVFDDGDTIRVHINDFLVNILLRIESEYVRVVCKDASRNFVSIYGYDDYEEPCEAFDEVSSLLRQEELLTSLADLIRFRRGLAYSDDVVDDILEDLQDYMVRRLDEYLCVGDVDVH